MRRRCWRKPGGLSGEVCQLHNEAPPLFVDSSAAAAARPRLYDDCLQLTEYEKEPVEPACLTITLEMTAGFVREFPPQRGSHPDSFTR